TPMADSVHMSRSRGHQAVTESAIGVSKFDVHDGGHALGLVEFGHADGGFCHQAVTESAIGVSKFDKAKGVPTVVDVAYYPADCVNPPDGTKGEAWIKGG